MQAQVSDTTMPNSSKKASAIIILNYKVEEMSCDRKVLPKENEEAKMQSLLLLLCVCGCITFASGTCSTRVLPITMLQLLVATSYPVLFFLRAAPSPGLLHILPFGEPVAKR